MTDLTALLERVKGATGPDRELDRDIGLAIAGWQLNDDLATPSLLIDGSYYADHPGGEYPALTESIDAALALVEKKLPRWWGSVDVGAWGKQWSAGLNYTGVKAQGYGTSPPLAILGALLAALIAQDKAA